MLQDIQNPFAGDADRAAIWIMLMTRDFEAFAAGDWTMVEDDFVSDGFFGVHGHFEADADRWQPDFPTLASYRDEWLRQARDTASEIDRTALVPALHAIARLDQIDIKGDFAVAHKKFSGRLKLQAGGQTDPLCWQTLYFCQRSSGGWKISGFVGYIHYDPAPAGAQD